MTLELEAAFQDVQSMKPTEPCRECEGTGEIKLWRDYAPYGFCPNCRAKGFSRERRPDGNDKCVNGHVYPSKEAII